MRCKNCSRARVAGERLRGLCYTGDEERSQWFNERMGKPIEKNEEYGK